MLDAVTKPKKSKHTKHSSPAGGFSKKQSHTRLWIAVFASMVVVIGLWTWSFQKTIIKVSIEQSEESDQGDYEKVKQQMSDSLELMKSNIAQLKNLRQITSSNQASALTDEQITSMVEKLKTEGEVKGVKRLPGGEDNKDTRIQDARYKQAPSSKHQISNKF